MHGRENIHMNKDQVRGMRPRHGTGILLLICFLCLPCNSVRADTPCEGFEQIKQELELTKQSLKNYKDLYERKDREINALNSKLNKLQDGFDKFQEISDRLAKEKEALQAQQAELAAQLKRLEGQKAALEKQNKLLSDCTRESKQKSLDIAALTSMTKAEKQALGQKLKEAQAQVDSAMESNKDLSRKNADLKDKFTELSVKAAGLEQNNAQLQQQKESALTQAQGLAREIELVKAKLLTAQAENARLKESAGRASECEKTEARLEKNRGELARLKDENKKLSAAVLKQKDVETLQQEAALLRNEVTVLKKENKRQQSEIIKCKVNETLPEELKNARAKLAELESSREQLIREFTEKSKDQKKMVEELIDLRLRAGRQASQLEQLEAENKVLKAAPAPQPEKAAGIIDLERVNAELARLQEENARLRTAQAVKPGQDALLEELRQIREELARTDMENRKLRSASAAVPVQTRELQNEIKSLKAELSDLKEENTRLRQDPVAKRQEGYDEGIAVGLQRELDRTRKEVVGLQIQIERLEKENIQLKHATEQLQDQELLNKEAARLREKLALSEQERNLLRSEIAEARKQDGFVEGLKQGYEKEIAKLTDALEGAQIDNKKLSDEAIRLRQFEASTQDMADARKQIIKLAEEKQAVVVELEAMKLKQDKLVDQLVKARKEKEAIEEINRGKTGAQVERLQKDLKDAQEFSYQLVQEKAGYQVREKQLNNRISMLEDAVAQGEKAVAELQNKHAILKTEHAKLSEELAQTMVRLSESEKENKAIAGQSEAAKREIENLRAQLVQSQDIISKMKDEMYELRKSNDTLTEANARIVGQRAQETAIANAQLEQVKAHKDGEISALNQRFAKIRAEKDAEILAISEKAGKLEAELKNAQAVSLQLMQEKTGFSGQQKQMNEEYTRLQKQNTVMAQEIKKLEDQNTFLKNQFITVSQEANDMKRVARAGQKGAQPEERYLEELQQLKSELLRKSQQLRLYEQAGGDGISGRNKQLIDDYAKLKKQYDTLKARNAELETVKRQYEDYKEKSAKLHTETATLHYNLSVLYAQNREYQKAVAELDKVLELKPNDGEAYYNLGVIHGEYLNDRKKALGYFKKYLELSPKDQDADRIRKYVLTYETLDQ